MNDDPSAKLAGFGGLLLLVSIGQWFGLFWTVVELLLDVPGYADAWSDAALRRSAMGQAAIEIGFLAFMLYTTIMMSLKRREFPTLFRLQLALFVVVPLASTWWEQAATGKTVAGLDFAATATHAVMGMIGASISILYSLRSERVRNTFVY